MIGATAFIVKLPAYACRRCKGVFMEGTALEQADLEVACVLASRGQASGETFRIMRKTLGMRAAVLAQLLNVTAETISRWENDQRAVDVNAWLAVGSILLERTGRPCSTLKRLMALSKGTRLPKTVRIDLTRVVVPRLARASDRTPARRRGRSLRALPAVG